MFHVIQINEPLVPGAMSKAMEWNACIMLVLEVLEEKDFTMTWEIRKFVEQEGYYIDPNGQWSVSIVQPDE